MARQYISADVFQAETGLEVTPDVLCRASLAVDAALIGAMYDTGTDGTPTDADVLAALGSAASYQARAIVANEAAVQPLKSASLGGASYTYADRADTGLTIPKGGGLCPAAVAVLRVAGLLPVGVVSYG